MEVQKHVNMLNKNKPFMCPLCAKPLATHFSFNCHITGVHPNTPQAELDAFQVSLICSVTDPRQENARHDKH